MNARTLTAIAGVLAAPALAGCSDGGPRLAASVAFVRGVVTAADGSPVDGARVLLEVRLVGDTVPVGREPTDTDAAGRYEILLGILRPPFDGLLDVTVTPPDTTVLRPGAVTDRPVRFNPPEERDTLRVNVVLEPA